MARGIIVTTKKYLYHITPLKHLDNILKYGLLPYPTHGKRFGPLSPELYTSNEKIIYFLPDLRTKSTQIFIDEWWHGDIKEAVLLRINTKNGKFYGSEDPYYQKCELWTYENILPDMIEFSKQIKQPHWQK